MSGKIKKQKNPMEKKKSEFPPEDSNESNDSDEDTIQHDNQNMQKVTEKTQKGKSTRPIPPKHTSTNVYNINVYKFSMIMISVIILSVAYYSTIPNKRKFDSRRSFYIFNQSLADMKSKFINQYDLTWKIILSSVKNVLNGTGDLPSVLMLATSPDAQNVSSCLALEIANAITSSLDVPRISQIVKYKQNQEKLEIDDHIKQSLERSSTVVIENLKSFSFQSFGLLQGYCDEIGAPYNPSFFILILNCDSSFQKSPDKTKHFDEYATRELRNAWKVTSDEIEPILSRITRSVVVIKNEDGPNDCK